MESQTESLEITTESMDGSHADYSHDDAEPSLTNAPLHDNDAGVTLDAREIGGIIGFGLYLSWFVLTLVNPLFGDSDVKGLEGVGLVFCFFAGEAVASLVVWLSSKYLIIGRHFVLTIIIAALLTPLPGLTQALDTSALFLFAAWTLAGFGAVFLLSVAGVFLSQLPHKRAILYPAISIFIMGVIVLSILFLFKNETVSYMLIAIPLVSIALFVFWIQSFSRMKDLLGYYDLNKPPDWRSLFHSSGAMVANSTLLGFSIYVVSITAPSHISALLLVAVLAAALYKILDSQHNQRFEVSEIIRVLAPAAAIGFLLLPFGGDEVRIPCCILIILVGALDEVVCWSAVSEYMHVYRLNPFTNMAVGRFGDVIGLTLGYASAWLVFGFTFDGAIAHPIVLCLLTILFILLQTFFFRDNYVPFSEHNKKADGSYDSVQADNSQGKPDLKRGRWLRKCDSFSEYYKLTPRQKEVFVMLAKGYTTSYIRNVLVVSDHTIKAHVFNIYRKVDVHSRQDLIEKFEAFEGDDDKPSSMD